MTNIPTKPQRYFSFHQRQQQRRGSFPCMALIGIHKFVQGRHFNMDTEIADSDVGRNKAIQARSARWRFRRVREVFAGNASSRCRSDRLIPTCFEMWLMRRNAGHLNVGRSASHIAFPRSAWERELSKMLHKAEHHD